MGIDLTFLFPILHTITSKIFYEIMENFIHIIMKMTMTFENGL